MNRVWFLSVFVVNTIVVSGSHYPTPDPSRAYEITNHVNHIHTQLNGQDSGFIQSSYPGGALDSDKPIQGYLYYYSPVAYQGDEGSKKASRRSGFSFSPNLFTGFFMGPLILFVGLSLLLPLGGVSISAGRSLKG